MKVTMPTFWIIFFTIVFLFSCLPSVTSQLRHDNYPTANLPKLWINDDRNFTADRSWQESNSTLRIILRRRNIDGPGYGCGFYTNGTQDYYLFAVFILDTMYDGFVSAFTPLVIWTANRNNPVRINSTLELTGEGDLVLKDEDGKFVWSTNTAGRSVARLSLTERGSLVLLDAKSSVVWQSIVHPIELTYPSANLSTVWVNNDNNFSPERRLRSSARMILRSGATSGQGYACGFFCSNDTCDSTLFAIFIFNTNNEIPSDSSTRISEAVWSANRNNPVGIDSKLELTAEGDLVLRDEDDTLVWSTNTAGRSVVRLSLTKMGNLVLLDANSSVVWQSFDHPTDCLLPRQILKAGMSLTASSPLANGTEGGLYSVSLVDEELVASIQSDSPLVYFTLRLDKDGFFNYMKRTPTQYSKLGPDGHLRLFNWTDYDSWDEVADIFTNSGLSECEYPLVCGKYGICENGQCSCPNNIHFKEVNDSFLDHVCSVVVPLTCSASENHHLLDLDNVTYFAFTADIVEIDKSGCKEACLKNCSCKAAIFKNNSCYMPSQIFSLQQNDTVDSSTYSVSIKIQNATLSAEATGSMLWPILGSTLGGTFVAILIGTAVFVCRRRRGRSEEVEEDYFDHVPGMPTRFSFEELAIATDNFKKKLGEGGFGSVFEGSFSDGTRIAVKRLDGVGHVKKSFLAEVQSIGSIHHINLVRLIGFCAEKSHRLLVYAYMCNGSLERWIYCKSHDKMLEWSCRRSIILDIAKGLAYLHEKCVLKIIHLDIKPQNILLDERFNAKLGDFGLSKLIDRDQSNVVTTMRGTPGYLAPEWLKSAITEKVDVYSFGVVILEIVSGRKIFEETRPEEERHLTTLFMKKAEEGLWLDLVDKCCLDVDSNVGEVEEMMQIAAWCLQSAPEKRPYMSMVINILEGVNNVPKDMNYNFLINQVPQVSSKDATPLLPSVLSGPR